MAKILSALFRVKTFTDRDSLPSAFARALHNTPTPRKSWTITMWAPTKTGKSTFAHDLVDEYRSLRPDAHGIIEDVAATNSAQESKLLAMISGPLMLLEPSWLWERPDDYKDRHEDEDFRCFHNLSGGSRASQENAKPGNILRIYEHGMIPELRHSDFIIGMRRPLLSVDPLKEFWDQNEGYSDFNTSDVRRKRVINIRPLTPEACNALQNIHLAGPEA